MKTLSQIHKENISKSLKAIGGSKGMLGKKLSEETKKKMSLAHLGNKSRTGMTNSISHRINAGLALRGEKHGNWKGGITQENHSRRNQLEYKQWRNAVFTRDGFKCKIAKEDCVHEVHAHHILRFSEHAELRYIVSNGITLCKNHHPLGKEKEQKLIPIFNELIYGNRG